MFENIQRTPDVVMIETKQASQQNGSEGMFFLGDVSVQTIQHEDRLTVSVTSLTTPMKKIRLRWLFSDRLKGQVLGDAWERSYGDLGW